MNDLIARFEAENPGIAVEQEFQQDASNVIKVKLASGDIPDISTVYAQDYVDQGLYVDLTGETEWWSRVNPAIREMCTDVKTGRQYRIATNVTMAGIFYNKSIFSDLGLTIGESVEAGGHTNAVKAVYNGEVDVATSYFSAPLLPEGTWSADMSPEPYLDLLEECGPNDEGQLWCGGYRVLDARATLTEEAPDVVQKVRILALSPEIPNDTMSFAPEFPEDLRQTIIDGVLAFLGTELCEQSLCHENFYDWTGAGPIFDENFDGVRILIAEQGITLENIGE
jgi:hypothetical protein